MLISMVARPLRRCWLLSALTVAGLLTGPGLSDGRATAADRRPPTVLVLVPGQPTGTQTNIDAFAAGTRRALQDALPVGSSVYLEYTDLARPGADHVRLRDWYRSKYANQPFDLIIAGGQEARVFLTRFRSELWPDVPILVAAMDDRSFSPANVPPDAVAQTVGYDEEGTLRAALALVPDAQYFALVAGASNLDRYLARLWTSPLERVGRGLRLIDLTGLPFEELKRRLGTLPPHTIAVFSSIFADGDGRAFVNPEVLPVITATANCPVFAIHGSYLGLGVVGGSMTDYGLLGAHAGGIGARMLTGLPVPPSPIRATGVNRLTFDWRELRRWQLQESRLPAGSVVMHRPPSAWEQYRWPIVIALSVLLAQAFLIGALLVHRAHRRQVERQLDERLHFETFLAQLSRSFVDLPAEQIDAAIRHGLAHIGAFLALDRVTLIALASRRGRTRTIAAWAGSDVTPVPAEMPAERFPWVSQQIARGEVMAFSRPESLPDEAAVDRASFAAHGTVSHALVPMVEDGVVTRALALTTVREPRAWPEPVVEQIRSIADILSQVLARKQAEAEIEESRALQGAMLSSLPSRIAVLDRDGRILAVNHAWLHEAEDTDAGLWRRAVVGRIYADICREAVEAGEDGAAEVLASVQAGLDGAEDEGDVEYSEKRESGKHWFRLSVIPLRGGRGVVLARTDVTDQVLAREQLRQFSGHLLAAQEDERRRIARELHDDLNQRLVLLALEISQTDPTGDRSPDNPSAEAQAAGDEPGRGRLRQLAERVGQIASDVHRLAYRLHPFKLEYLGLAAAARGLCEEIDAAHQIAITFIERDVPSSLAPDVAVCVYRVLQEALSNVIKHSGSPRAEIELVGEGASIRLSVRDFGMGMAPEVLATSRGLGLSSMRERVRAADGHLVIESAVAAGTELTVRIPLGGPREP
jgi:signal transduction histidine kinase